MASKDKITAEQIRAAFDYDPESGILTWKKRDSSLFNTRQGQNRTNGRLTGKVAGSQNKHKGYLEVRFLGVLLHCHLVIWMWMTGEWPKFQVDHRDGNRANNKWRNLREATPQEQAQNVGRRKDNTSGHQGVSLNSQKGLYEAYININGVRYHKWHNNLEAAVAWRTRMKDQLHEFHNENPDRESFRKVDWTEITLEDLQ